MTVPVNDPNPLEKYVDANGRLTLEGLKLLQAAIRAIRDHEDRIVALEP